METFIDNGTKGVVGFDYILEGIEVKTPYGLENKKKLKPFLPGEEELLIDELKRIDELIILLKSERTTFIHINAILAHVKDIKKSLSRAVNGDTLTVVELFEVKTFILLLRRIHVKLKELNWDIPKNMKIKPIKALEDLFDPKGKGIETFYIYDEYSKLLGDIRDGKRILGKEIKKENKRIN